MREILFKAKRVDNGEWVYGYFLKDDCTGQLFIHASGNSVNESDRINEEGCLRFVAFEVDESTLCQYTGLTDKNGRKIWENDIVHVSYIDGMDECNELIEVTYTKHGFSPWSWEYSCDGCDLYCELLSVGVVGNVFDNPELLEKAR